MAVLIAVLNAGERYFQRHPLSRRQLSVIFVIMSLVTSAWCVAFWGRGLTFFAMVLLSVMFAWAALGTAYEWSGFRPEPDPDEIEDGLYDDELDAQPRVGEDSARRDHQAN